MTLRNSYVNCPTRSQPSWGWIATDAPAVFVNAPDVEIAYNTITCSGYDNEICSRNVYLGGARAHVHHNDLSFARGAVQMGTDSLVEYNYMHSFSFGGDARQQDSGNNAQVTHNNAVNNYGVSGSRLIGNYIQASYGRVSADPQRFKVQQWLGIFENGVVDVGDPLNGFAVINYLINGDGAQTVIRNNYFADVGRTYFCDTSGRSQGTCAADMSLNGFGANRFALYTLDYAYPWVIGGGSLAGGCNFLVDSGTDPSVEYLPSSFFPGHRTTC